MVSDKDHDSVSNLMFQMIQEFLFRFGIQIYFSYRKFLSKDYATSVRPATSLSLKLLLIYENNY